MDSPPQLSLYPSVNPTLPIDYSFAITSLSIRLKDQPAPTVWNSKNDDTRKGVLTIRQMPIEKIFVNLTDTSSYSSVTNESAKFDWNSQELNAIILETVTPEPKTSSTVTLTLRNTSMTKVELILDLHQQTGFRNHLLHRLSNRLKNWSLKYQIPSRISFSSFSPCSPPSIKKTLTLRSRNSDQTVIEIPLLGEEPFDRIKTPPGFKEGVSSTLAFKIGPPPPPSPPPQLGTSQSQSEETIQLNPAAGKKKKKSTTKTSNSFEKGKGKGKEIVSTSTNSFEIQAPLPLLPPSSLPLPSSSLTNYPKQQSGKGKEKESGTGTGTVVIKVKSSTGGGRTAAQVKKSTTKPLNGTTGRRVSKPPRGYVIESESSSSEEEEQEDGKEKKKKNKKSNKRSKSIFEVVELVDPTGEGKRSRRESTIKKSISYVEKGLESFEEEEREDEKEGESQSDLDSDSEEDDDDNAVVENGKFGTSSSSRKRKRQSSTTSSTRPRPQRRRSTSTSNLLASLVPSNPKGSKKRQSSDVKTKLPTAKKKRTSTTTTTTTSSKRKRNQQKRSQSHSSSLSSSSDYSNYSSDSDSTNEMILPSRGRSGSTRSREKTFSPSPTPETTESERKRRSRSNRDVLAPPPPPSLELMDQIREIGNQLKELENRLENGLEKRLESIEKIVWDKEYRVVRGGGVSQEAEGGGVVVASISRESRAKSIGGGGEENLMYDVRFLMNSYEDLRVRIVGLAEDTRNVKRKLVGQIQGAGRQGGSETATIEIRDGGGGGGSTRDPDGMDIDGLAVTEIGSQDLLVLLQQIESLTNTVSNLEKNLTIVQQTASSALTRSEETNVRIDQLEKEKQDWLQREGERQVRDQEVEKHRREDREKLVQMEERMEKMEEMLKALSQSNQAAVLPALPPHNPQQLLFNPLASSSSSSSNPLPPATLPILPPTSSSSAPLTRTSSRLATATQKDLSRRGEAVFSSRGSPPYSSSRSKSTTASTQAPRTTGGGGRGKSGSRNSQPPAAGPSNPVPLPTPTRRESPYGTRRSLRSQTVDPTSSTVSGLPVPAPGSQLLIHESPDSLTPVPSNSEDGNADLSNSDRQPRASTSGAREGSPEIEITAEDEAIFQQIQEMANEGHIMNEEEKRQLRLLEGTRKNFIMGSSTE